MGSGLWVLGCRVWAFGFYVLLGLKGSRLRFAA